MSLNNKTYQPVQSISLEAGEDLPAFRFISHLGTLCADESRAVGVTEVDWLSGEMASVVTLGTMTVETAGTISIGADLTSAALGKAKTAEAAEPVNGRALDSCSGAGYVKIKIVP